MTTAKAIRIPDLPAASSLSDSDLLLVYQSGQTRKLPASLIGSSAPASSPTLTVSVTAGVALSGHKAVVMAAGGAVYADAATATHRGRVLGITTGAASSGAAVEVATAGPLTEPSWAWMPDLPVYLGSGGALTQTVPTGGGTLQILGIAITATTLQIHLREPIALT